MKMRFASLTILCLALAAVPAFAQWSYDNGPINGTTDAWTINFGYVVSDTFFTSTNNPTVTGFSAGVWEFPGDSVTSVDWSITGSENAPCPSELCLGNGTARVSDKFISTNQFGYNIDVITATGLNVLIPGGVNEWLNLQNAVGFTGDPVYWDENSGPSMASESSVGTIPSEAFTIGGTSGAALEATHPIAPRLSPAASCCLVLAFWAWPAYCVANCSKHSGLVRELNLKGGFDP